ncbi:hypothetical protein D3C85_1619230 [compost metagenome]
MAVEGDAQSHHGGTEQQRQGILPEEMMDENIGDLFGVPAIRAVVSHGVISRLISKAAA